MKDFDFKLRQRYDRKEEERLLKKERKELKKWEKEKLRHTNAVLQASEAIAGIRPYDTPIVHGFMQYSCKNCGEMWYMFLEIGVEDFGRHGREHQPCPFCIPCDCGHFANDISGYQQIRPQFVSPGMRYFAYDSSGKEDACGIPTVWEG